MTRFFKLKYFKTNGINTHAYSKGHYGNCVLCGDFTKLDPHHKITQSRGGKDEDEILVCRRCHNWINNHIEEAIKKGVYLRGYKNEKGITKTTAD